MRLPIYRCASTPPPEDMDTRSGRDAVMPSSAPRAAAVSAELLSRIARTTRGHQEFRSVSDVIFVSGSPPILSAIATLVRRADSASARKPRKTCQGPAQLLRALLLDQPRRSTN